MVVTMRTGKTNTIILSDNNYQLIITTLGKGIKQKIKILAVNLGWYTKNNNSYDMEIRREKGRGEIKYGDVVALRMGPSYSGLKYKNQNYATNLNSDDDNPHYIWIVKGGKKGQNLTSGMAFALFNMKESREVIYCPHFHEVNLGWQWLKCSRWHTVISNQVSGEDMLLQQQLKSVKSYYYKLK